MDRAGLDFLSRYVGAGWRRQIEIATRRRHVLTEGYGGINQRIIFGFCTILPALIRNTEYGFDFEFLRNFALFYFLKAIVTIKLKINSMYSSKDY